jgi:hypothetical protein
VDCNDDASLDESINHAAADEVIDGELNGSAMLSV